LNTSGVACPAVEAIIKSREGKIETISQPIGNEPIEGLHEARRKVVLRDSLAFLVLLAATLALSLITSFLFNSFAERRAEIAKTYAAQGKATMSAGHPEQAIGALRVAIEYAPSERSNHLLLAEALAEAHHTDEATDYFRNLWDAQPADGFVNLQLARLARSRGNTRQAIDYYRAAAAGNWEDDNENLRRQVQVELSDYLTENGQMAAARGELLIMAANAPENPGLDILVGDKLQQADDLNDALSYYKKAIALEPHNATALYKAGSVEYMLGDFTHAHKFLALALREQPAESLNQTNVQQLSTLSNNTERILQLTLSSDLPAQERAAHLLTAASIAKVRFDACSAQLQNNPIAAASLAALKPEWQSATRFLNRKVSLQNANDQNSLAQLVFNSEVQTSRVCGPPTGDDALLLQLAKSEGQAQ
jgi:tetratricopeptide (TPR) repeat protein